MLIHYAKFDQTPMLTFKISGGFQGPPLYETLTLKVNIPIHDSVHCSNMYNMCSIHMHIHVHVRMYTTECCICSLLQGMQSWILRLCLWTVASATPSSCSPGWTLSGTVYIHILYFTVQYSTAQYRDHARCNIRQTCTSRTYGIQKLLQADTQD